LDPSKPSPADESKKFSKFNGLAVAFAFGITGLTVVYLPSVLHKSIDWTVEGRWVGVILAAIGTSFALMEAAKLTNRKGFEDWGMALLFGFISAVMAIVLNKYHISGGWTTVLLVLTIVLIFFTIYGIASGFAQFFDDPGRAASVANATPGSDTSSATVDAEIDKKLSWYERITLLIAVVSAIATVAAAVEPVVHP